MKDSNESNESKSAAKVYTRTGDQGTTSLFGGARVNKDDMRLEAYGTLDELNSVVGVLVAEIQNESWSGSSSVEIDRVKTELTAIQEQLFVLGAHLATGTSDSTSANETEQKFRDMLPELNEDYVTRLEVAMDRMSVALQPLKNFVLPGGTRPAAYAHLARTVARRAERAIVAAYPREGAHGQVQIIKHVNRLNDYFFVLARHLNRLQHHEEPIWKS
jgi:cob(I)alamin adenosyltransferase